MTANVMRPARRALRTDEPEWAVWLLVAVMLAAALLVRWAVGTRTQTFDEGGIALSYPADWVRLPTEEAFDVVLVSEPFETALFPTAVHVRQMPVTEISDSAQTMGDLALKWTNQQRDTLTAYRVFGLEPQQVNGKEGVRVDYAYVGEPLLGGPTVPPIVVRGEDILIRNGDTVTIASFVANDTVYASQTGLRDRILASLEVK